MAMGIGLPKVSVLIPTRNRPDFFEGALTSALAQSYQNLEIIVCDNSSDDLTETRVRPYLERFPQISYRHNESDLGMVGNLRRCLDFSSGDYVNYLMDDDLFEADKIRRMMAFLLAYEDVSLVTSARRLIDKDGRALPVQAFAAPLFGKDTMVDGFVLGDYLLTQTTNHIGEPTTVLFRKAALDEPFGRFLGREYGCNIDLAAWLKLLAKGKAVYLVDPLSSFRVHESQESRSLKMTVLGTADWAHQVLASRELGFLRKEADFEAAAERCLAMASELMRDAGDEEKRRLVAESDLVRLSADLLGALNAVRHKKGGCAADGQPLVSVIIPTFNKWAYTSKCLQKLAQNTSDVPYETIVVDNASTDPTRESLTRLGQPLRTKLNDSNLGFAKACNQGAAMARGKYLLFLNNDTEPQPGWLQAVVRAAEADPSVAVVGSKLLFPDGTVQHGGVGFAYAEPFPISPYHLDYRQPAAGSDEVRELEAVTGACLLTRADVFNAVGGFDEGYLNGYEDVDFCLKVRATGGRIIYTPDSVVIHHESVSDGRFLKALENIELLHRRWMGRFTGFNRDTHTGAAPGGTDPNRPGVSIVTVTRNCLESIAIFLENLLLHTGWQDEIIVVDNASTDPTLQFIELFVRRHPGRLKVVKLEDNRGFPAAANIGLGKAHKDFVVLVHPDVQVNPGWLDRLLAHLRSNPALGAVGPVAERAGGAQDLKRYAKLEHPQPPAAISAALAGHFGRRGVESPSLEGFCLMLRRKHLKSAGYLDPDLFAHWDLDLSLRLRRQGLRLMAAVDVFVGHFRSDVPRRPEAGLKYLVQQSANALYDKLYREHGGQVPDSVTLWGVDEFKPQTGLTSIVIPVRDQLELTRLCLASIYANTPRDFEVVLVDNGSREDVGALAAEIAQKRGHLRYVRNEDNQGFAYACNQGLAQARGEYVVFLNNDTIVTPGWLSRQLALFAEDPSIGAVGPVSNRASGCQQVDEVAYTDSKSLLAFAEGWRRQNTGQFTRTDRVIGLCLVVRREVLEKVGGFDTTFGIGNFEDDDFCLRLLRAGYNLAVARDVFIHHHGSATFKALGVDYAALMEENWRHFCHKWGHQGPLSQGLPYRQTALARPFDPAWDHVPWRYEEVFHPGAAPLALQDPRPIRLLCIPDWSGSAWREVVGAYLKTFRAADPVTLLVRIEPPLPALIDQAWAEVSAILEGLGLDEESAPDLIFETTAIPGRFRGSLYTAATAFVPCPGGRAGLYTREAAACGLPAVRGLTREAVLRLDGSVAGSG